MRIMVSPPMNNRARRVKVINSASVAGIAVAFHANAGAVVYVVATQQMALADDGSIVPVFAVDDLESAIRRAIWSRRSVQVIRTPWGTVARRHGSALHLPATDSWPSSVRHESTSSSTAWSGAMPEWFS